MKVVAIAVFLAVVLSPCHNKAIPDEPSVVSVYTTIPTTSATAELDVYQLIANNLAERITSPFYRIFGIGGNKTENHNQTTTKKPLLWDNIELLEEPDKIVPEDNLLEISDTEELSEKALKKAVTKNKNKPEKIVLYNSYLPLKDGTNETADPEFLDDEDFSLDDVDSSSGKMQGPFIYVLELIGSFIQLAWGAIQSIFNPTKQSS